MQGNNLRRTARIAFLTGASLMAVACQPPQPVKTTARVCDPHNDATCKPTPNTKVVVK